MTGLLPYGVFVVIGALFFASVLIVAIFTKKKRIPRRTLQRPQPEKPPLQEEPAPVVTPPQEAHGGHEHHKHGHAVADGIQKYVGYGLVYGFMALCAVGGGFVLFLIGLFWWWIYSSTK